MKYCSKCGKEIPDDSSFCMYCGASLTEHASLANRYKNEVVFLEVTRDNSAYIKNLLFKTKEPLFSEIKQGLDDYMQDAIKERYYNDYLRKCDIRSYSTGTELICKTGFSGGYGKWVYEGLMFIFDQNGFDMKVESNVPIIIGGNSRGSKTIYRGKR